MELLNVNGTKVERTVEGHYWVEYKPGRSRLALKGSELWQRIEAGRAGVTARPTTAPGTFTPVVYFRNPDGSIGIPPSPDSPIPPTAIRCEARTLREIDSVTREMNLDDARRFSDDDSFREGFAREVFGTDPRSDLRTRLANSRSNKERDFIRHALEKSEEASHSARSFRGESSFHFRNYDR